MTSLRLWILAGMLVGAGVAVAVAWAWPAEPDLASALARLSPRAARGRRVLTVGAGDPGERAGLWVMRHLPLGCLKVPTKDLAVLRKSVASFYGDKLAFAALGAVASPLLALIFSLSFEMPVTIPVAVSLAGVAAGWFLPDVNIKQDATRARAEFSRAMGSYVDLVALERHGGGSGSRQAMELAAEIGDSWPFRRITEELSRSRFSGQQPWDALHVLADELAIPDIADVADIMRLCGEEGAQVYETLRARAMASRNALLTADQAEANAIGERMFIPASLTAVVFLAILIAPALFRLLIP